MNQSNTAGLSSCSFISLATVVDHTPLRQALKNGETCGKRFLGSTQDLASASWPTVTVTAVRPWRLDFISLEGDK